MARGYLGIRDIIKTVWGPATGNGKSGVFPNFAKADAPTVRPDGTAIAEGDIYENSTSHTWYGRINGSWSALGGTTSSLTLDQAYENGNEISRSATNPVLISDAIADAVNTLSLTKGAAGSGNVFGISFTGAHTGDALNINMANAAVTGQALVIAGQSAARTTSALVQVTENGTGALATVNITNETGVSTGPLLSLTTTSAIAPVANTDGMMTINMTNAATTAQGLLIIGPAAGRTGAMLRMTDAGSSSGSVISIAQSGTSSASVIAYTTSAAMTGDAINLNMANAGATSQALVITGPTTASAHLVSITSTAGAGDFVRIVSDGATTGSHLYVSGAGSANPTADTKGLVTIVTTSSNNAAQGLLVYNNTAAHTGPLIRCYDAAGTGSLPLVSLYTAAANTGNLLTISTGAAITGDAINVTMTNAAVGAQALVITGQAAIRTGVGLVYIDEAGTGAVPTVSIKATAATTGPLFKLSASAAAAPVADTNGMATIDVTAAADAAQGVLVYNNTATHTGELVRIYDAAATGSCGLLSLYTNAANTSNLFSIAAGAAITGDAINVTMTNAAVGAQALVVTGQAAIRTGVGLIYIDEAGTGAVPTVAIKATAATTGPLFKLHASAAAAQVANTDGMATIDVTGTANATQGLLLYNNTAAHTGAMLRIYDAAGTGAGQGIGIAYGAAAAGDAINVTMTNAAVGAQAAVIVGQAGARTGAGLVTITENGTGAVPTMSISGDAASTGPLLTLLATAAVAPVSGTNGMLTLNMTNAAAATDGALIIQQAASTGSALYIKSAGAGAGAAGVLKIACSGVQTGNAIDVTYSGAATGHGLNIAMTNTANTASGIVVTGVATKTVAAVSIGTTGVGANNVPGGLHVTGAADLAAGADLVRFASTGNISATSNILALEQSAGAGITGANCLYISATGANVQAIKVDDGDVVLDEGLAVAGIVQFNGAQTLTGAGAVNLTTTVTLVDTTGGAAALTLADASVVGHIKIITMTVDGGDGTLTPTTLIGAATTITFNDIGDSVILVWTGALGWNILANYGCTVA